MLAGATWYFTPEVLLAAIRSEPLRRELIAPCVEDGAISAHIPCIRPSRVGGPRVDVEYGPFAPNYAGPKVKAIFHNYGHGGSGWTLAPGCVQHLMQSFLASRRQQKTETQPGNKTPSAPPTDAPIAVIGAGVFGLMTLWQLSLRGYTNVTLVAECDSDLTSHKAAGLAGVFALPSASNSEFIEQAAVDSFRFYERVRAGHELAHIPDHLVRRIPLYLRPGETDCVYYVKHGLMKPSTLVDVVFRDARSGHVVSAPRRLEEHMDGMFLDVGGLMKALEEVALPCAKRLQTKRIHSFADLPKETEYIFNCTGLGARTLARDTNVYGVGGHLLELQDQPRNSTTDTNTAQKTNTSAKPAADYMLMATLRGSGCDGSVKDCQGLPVEEHIYYMPKNGQGVIGGTLVKGLTDPSQCIFDPFEFDRILKDAREFFRSTVPQSKYY